MADPSSVKPMIDAIDWRAGAGRDKTGKMLAVANERIAKGLGKLAKPDNKEAIDALIKLADSNHLNTQLAAVVSLGQLKAAAAVDQLLLVADGSSNNFMVKNATIALGKIADARAVPVLVKLLFFERAGVSFYAEASYSLFQIGKPAVPALIETYKGTHKGLTRLHLDEGVRKTKAIIILADIENSPEVEKLALELAKYAGQGGYVARREAQTVLGRMGVKAAVPILMENYDNVDMSQSAYTLNALERIGDRRMLKDLTNMTTQAGYMKQCTSGQGSEKQCKKHESAIRKTRLATLSRLGNKDTMTMVKEILEVEKPTNKKLLKEAQAAKGRLEANVACDGKDLVCWMDQLKAKNPRTREKAAYELMWRKNSDSIDALVGQLGDEDNEARFPAILALWRMIPNQNNDKIVAHIDGILKKEKGQTQYVRINEDLKRLRIKLARGY
ncbi:MAG: hypothetical protein CMH56_06560 [Myxococcales bacterium]|nr:hypothetical protein [Myxococcales bacterium]